MNDVQQALLIKNAYKHPHETNTTALVTANGHVTIAHVDNLNTLFQFTLEQWQEIVDFVSIAAWGELRDKPEVETEEDWVDWSKVQQGYNWVAVDENGSVFAYNFEPVISSDNDQWILSDEEDADFINLQQKIFHINWKKSLRKRPTSK